MLHIIIFVFSFFGVYSKVIIEDCSIIECFIYEEFCFHPGLHKSYRCYEISMNIEISINNKIFSKHFPKRKYDWFHNVKMCNQKNVSCYYDDDYIIETLSPTNHNNTSLMVAVLIVIFIVPWIILGISILKFLRNGEPQNAPPYDRDANHNVVHTSIGILVV